MVTVYEFVCHVGEKPYLVTLWVSLNGREPLRAQMYRATYEGKEVNANHPDWPQIITAIGEELGRIQEKGRIDRQVQP